MQIELKKMVIAPDIPLFDAMSVIDKNTKGMVFVCKDGVLTGSLTDGDIRRHILKKGSLDIAVDEVANHNFIFARVGQSYQELDEIFHKYRIDCIPIIDDQGQLVDIQFANAYDEVNKAELNVPVVIMAGGKGTRLYPYTKVLPKPLIPIGDLTITQHILNQFKEYGCNDFTMIVNHKKNMIKAFFSDEETDYNIDFIDETIPLGTGGGLKLLDGKVKETFFMSNCDILVFEDYEKILQYHKKADNILTMVCSTKKVTIPYGIVDINEQGNIDSLTEKPSFSFLTNTGFYVIEPKFLEYIPENAFMHITDIIQNCIDNGCKVGIYPISESQWSDMGQLEEMEKMREKLEL